VQKSHVGHICHHSLLSEGWVPVALTDEKYSDAVCFSFDDDGNPDYLPISVSRAMDNNDSEREKQEFVHAAGSCIDAGIDTGIDTGMDGIGIHGAKG